MKKSVVRFLVGFVVALFAGRAIEVATDERTIASIGKAQTRWISTVSDMSPLSLLFGYWGDISAVLRGDSAWTPSPPPPRLRVCKSDDDREFVALGCDQSLLTLERCQEVQAKLANSDIPDCLPDETSADDPLARFNSAMEATTQQLTSEGEDTPPFYVVPAVALLRTWSRLTDGGGIAYFYAFLQLGVGALLFFALFRPWRDTNVVVALLLWPLGVIAAASTAALVYKWTMLGALFALGWVTGLAAFSTGCTGVAGACWYGFVKLTEHSAEKVLTPRI